MTIHASEKIHKVFAESADVYDKMNNWMSFGLHHQWKKKLIETIDWPKNHKIPVRILDMAGGTGDITLLLQEKAKRDHRAVQLTLADPNLHMLAEARKRHPQVAWDFLETPAEKVPLPSNTVDIYTMAFGLRNIQKKSAALKETLRLLKPGGHFYCLEFSQPETVSLQSLFQLYNKIWLPFLAHAIAKKPGPYRYLAESVKAFPKAPIVLEMIQSAGFKNVSFKHISGGILAIHKACKPL